MKNWSSVVKWDSFHSVTDRFGGSCSLHNAWWLLEPSLYSFRSNYFPVRHKITEWELLESRWVIALLVCLLGRPVVQSITSGSEKPWATHCWVWAAPGIAVGASTFTAWLIELSPPMYLPNLICRYRKSHVQCEEEFKKKMKSYMEKAGSSPFVPILCVFSLFSPRPLKISGLSYKSYLDVVKQSMRSPRVWHDWVTKQPHTVSNNILAPWLSMIFLPFFSWRGGPLSHLLALFTDSGCSTDQWWESSFDTLNWGIWLFFQSLHLFCTAWWY